MRRDALRRRLKFCRASHSHSVQNYTQISKQRKILMQKLQLYNLSIRAVFDIESRSGYPNAGNELFPPAHPSREFSQQLDEATEGSRDAHLICYVCFVDFSDHNLVEELLFCKPFELGCRGIYLFNIINDFFSTNNLNWQNCISIWTDGAKAVSGSRSGLRSLIQKRAPVAMWMHCMIHREALVARELSPELGATVEISPKSLTSSKHGH